MFYNTNVLSKKGPLARIWLAAHWEKKLTKAQVFDTSIEITVDGILKPKVKLALRTTGHLLLGTARILDRKAKYLLSECTEIFVKIKMYRQNQRPGFSIDLPPEKSRRNPALISTITLPQVFHDFDTDLTTFDASTLALLNNQAREDEITIREDFAFSSAFSSFSHHGDEPEMEAFDDNGLAISAPEDEDALIFIREMQADPSFVSASSSVNLKNGADISNYHLLSSSPHLCHNISATSPPPEDENENIAFEHVDVDVSASNMTPAMDPLGIDTTYEAAGLFEIAQPMSVLRDDKISDDLHTQDTSPGYSSHIDSVPFAPFTPGPEPPSVLTDAPLSVSSKCMSAVSNETTLISNTKEAFVLEPLDVTSLINSDGKSVKHKRKRKLILDAVKGSLADEMRAQLEDSSDIVTSLDLAPQTKRLMELRENGTAHKLLTHPGYSYPDSSSFIQKIYSIRCISIKAILMPTEGESIDDSIDPGFVRSMSPDAKRLKMTADLAISPSILSVDGSVKEPHTKSNQSQLSLSDVYDVPPLPIPEESLLPIPEEYSSSPFQSFVPDSPPEAISLGEKSITNEATVSLPKNDEMMEEDVIVGGEGRSLDDQSSFLQKGEKLEGENNTHFEERIWGKRVDLLLNAIKDNNKGNDGGSFGVKFSSLISSNSRKEVAIKFYSILALKKESIIDLKQASAYEEILINLN